ncbi:hypothetical protein [Streptomyces sp. NPDC090445]|uniref:hypothetical protein n=1 Tax=Streptomyces sp. NPDC090445 TaxID=3365963 RepID=UPI00382B5600
MGLEAIPDEPVNPRRLRRTLSVEMAARPGGLLATKVYFKHLQVATSEGYAGWPGGAQAVFHHDWKKDGFVGENGVLAQILGSQRGESSRCSKMREGLSLGSASADCLTTSNSDQPMVTSRAWTRAGSRWSSYAV